MKEFIIFYTDYPISINNNKYSALEYFEYGRKYEVIESYETDDWSEYHRKVSFGNGKYLTIRYNYDYSPYIPYEIQDGILIEYSKFPSYEYIEIDIQEERNKIIDSILK